jgi:hypothetical protein
MGFPGNAKYLRQTPVRRYAADRVGFPGDANRIHKKLLYLPSLTFINLH